MRVHGWLAALIAVLLASGCDAGFERADIDAAVAKALAEQATTTTAAPTTTTTATTIPVPEGVIYCRDSRGCTDEQIEEIKLGVRTLSGVRIGRDSSFPVYTTAEERQLADLEARDAEVVRLEDRIIELETELYLQKGCFNSGDGWRRVAADPWATGVYKRYEDC